MRDNRTYRGARRNLYRDNGWQWRWPGNWINRVMDRSYLHKSMGESQRVVASERQAASK